MPATLVLECFRQIESENVAWMRELSRLLPDFKLVEWRAGKTVIDPNDELWRQVRYLVIWHMPTPQMLTLPNLRAIHLVGSGADHLALHQIPEHIPIVRLVDPDVARDMAAYVMHWVIQFQIGLGEYLKFQQENRWQKLEFIPRFRFKVGVMGFGNVGSTVAKAAAALGYPVSAWSRNGTATEGVQAFAESQLDDFLSSVNVLVNVLPLTPETKNMLNTSVFEKLPRGAIVISIGRGATINEEHLFQALDNGQLRAFVADTFREEPLPTSSPLWSHEKILITPHVAGRTFAESSAKYVTANIERMERGEPAFPLVGRERGY